MFGPDHASGDTVTRVTAPGASSENRISSGGTISVAVTGAGDVGRPGESRVVQTLRAILKNEGVESRTRPGEDRRGEDALLEVGKPYVLQIVTVPPQAGFWQSARHGSASTSVPTSQAAEWIEQSIQMKVRKSSEADRPNTILILDAIHSGVLADDSVVAAYMERYGSPTQHHGFASVWIIGPTAQQSSRVGIGVL